MKQKLAFKATKFTEKEKRFVAEYQIDLNGTQAAIRAGYSPKTAKVIANQLLNKTLLSDAIKEQTEAALNKAGVRRDKVLTTMARISFHDIRNAFDLKTNTLLPVKDIPDELVPAIASIKVTELFEGVGEDRHLVGYTKEIRLWDPNPSLTNMAKNLGVIGNGKHPEEERPQGGVRVWTSMELAAKLVYYNQILKDLMAEVERTEEIEAKKALSDRSQDEKPT